MLYSEKVEITETSSGNQKWVLKFPHLEKTYINAITAKGGIALKVQGGKYEGQGHITQKPTLKEINKIATELYERIVEVDVRLANKIIYPDEEFKEVNKIVIDFRNKYTDPSQKGVKKPSQKRRKRSQNDKQKTLIESVEVPKIDNDKPKRVLQIPPIPVYAEDYEIVKEEVNIALQNLKPILNAIGVTIPEI